MPPRKFAPGPDQEVLFPLEEVAPAVPAPAAPAPPQLDPNAPPAAMHLKERAYEFAQAISEVNAASKRAGFQASANTPHRTKHEQRYGGGLGSVLDAAESNQRSNMAKVREHVTRLAAPYALIRAGFPEDKVWSMTSQLYREFTSRYGVGITTAQVRNKAAKQMQRTTKKITS